MYSSLEMKWKQTATVGVVFLCICRTFYSILFSDFVRRDSLFDILYEFMNSLRLYQSIHNFEWNTQNMSFDRLIKNKKHFIKTNEKKKLTETNKRMPKWNETIGMRVFFFKFFSRSKVSFVISFTLSIRSFFSNDYFEWMALQRWCLLPCYRSQLTHEMCWCRCNGQYWLMVSHLLAFVLFSTNAGNQFQLNVRVSCNRWHDCRKAQSILKSNVFIINLDALLFFRSPGPRFSLLHNFPVIQTNDSSFEFSLMILIGFFFFNFFIHLFQCSLFSCLSECNLMAMRKWTSIFFCRKLLLHFEKNNIYFNPFVDNRPHWECG